MPLSTTLAGLAGAFTLAAGSPLASAVPPVSVVACDYRVLPGTEITLTEVSPFQTASLRITFVNQAPITATNVRFAVRYADRTQTIDDSGQFASGAPITHDFTPATNTPYGGSAQCSVEAVTFSDGSIWQPA